MGNGSESSRRAGTTCEDLFDCASSEDECRDAAADLVDLELLGLFGPSPPFVLNSFETRCLPSTLAFSSAGKSSMSMA